MCGEQQIAIKDATSSIGSPPRVRGTAFLLELSHGFSGITPACAGNSGIVKDGASCTKDHPRVCGEQRPFCDLATKCAGSPPRVRGTAPIWIPSGSTSRITPACAGNSFFKLCSCMNFLDHPRVCGEQSANRYIPVPPEGSPPRVRGTGDLGMCSAGINGITPACAGNR